MLFTGSNNNKKNYMLEGVPIKKKSWNYESEICMNVSTILLLTKNNKNEQTRLVFFWKKIFKFQMKKACKKSREITAVLKLECGAL